MRWIGCYDATRCGFAESVFSTATLNGLTYTGLCQPALFLFLMYTMCCDNCQLWFIHKKMYPVTRMRLQGLPERAVAASQLTGTQEFASESKWSVIHCFPLWSGKAVRHANSYFQLRQGWAGLPATCCSAQHGITRISCVLDTGVLSHFSTTLQS